MNPIPITPADDAMPAKPSGPRRLTVGEYLAELKAQGVPRKHVAHKCIVCGTVQSMHTLVQVGCRSEDVQKFFGFSCIGRFTGAGPFEEGTPSGRGCDWTIGGLFGNLGRGVIVVTEDGVEHPRFDVATPDEARDLWASVLAQELVDERAAAMGTTPTPPEGGAA